MTFKKRTILLFALIGTLAACMPSPFYQGQEGIPHNEWKYSFKPKFTFEIKDTTAQYRPYFIIRHTQAYPYNNIWMWLRIKTPGSTTVQKTRVNVVLSEPSGKWLGRGMGEIYEQRMPISFGDSVKLDKAGTYTVELEQNMRIDPLPEVLHVGLRIEKTTLKGDR